MHLILHSILALEKLLSPAPGFLSMSNKTWLSNFLVTWLTARMHSNSSAGYFSYYLRVFSLPAVPFSISPLFLFSLQNFLRYATYIHWAKEVFKTDFVSNSLKPVYDLKCSIRTSYFVMRLLSFGGVQEREWCGGTVLGILKSKELYIYNSDWGTYRYFGFLSRA